MPFPVPKLAPAKTPLERLPEEWAEVLAGWGEPKYRGAQVFHWIHQRGVRDPLAMTDLPTSLRERIASEGGLGLPEVALFHESTDGTRKMLLRFEDGREIESVLLPQGAPGDLAAVPEDETEEVERDVPISQCISTQVGCAMGCVFCASGVAGLKRHLSAGEIVAQVLVGRERKTAGERIRNVVLMGMGEPLHNYDAVARALVLLTHPHGASLSARRVTLSTSGLVPQIDRLGADFGGQVQLAVSLHAVTDEQRSRLMPINRKHPIAELMDALRRYPLPRRRRITIEYTLIAGQNDDLRDADRLAVLLRGIPVKVNIIPMNAISGTALGAPDMSGVDAFVARLRDRGLAVFMRRTRGDDIAAACGQLALHGEKRKIRLASL